MKTYYGYYLGIVVALCTGVYIYNAKQPATDSVEGKTHAITNTNLVMQHATNEFAARDGFLDSKQAGVGLREQVTALSNDIVLLKAEILSLRTAMQAQNLASNTVVASSILSPSEEKQRLSEQRAHEEERFNQQAQLLEIDFRKQRLDANWATRTKNLIKAALEEEQIVPADIIGLECRSSMCRLELAIDNRDELASKLTMLPIKIGSELPSILISQHNDNQSNTILYLSKDDLVS
ncbi:hypothetical protein [Methylomonas sp. AM2-LC]|uniref:hypothetical protein n=1 Tax=Methylomonas sp. AM2-LC TaxID=3153301 RepID=UPI00326477A7